MKSESYARQSNRENVDKFHKTKLLLKIYRDVVWRIEDTLHDVEETAYHMGSKRISNLVDFLSVEIDEFDSSKDKKVIEERLMCVAESKGMIEIIDKALMKLKSHPDYGDIYFNIINANYIIREKMSDCEIQSKFHLSESTYYRYKRNAINLLGVILWGYISSIIFKML